MHRIDLRGRRLDRRSLRQVLPRAAFDVDAALAVVRPICEDVRLRGATALRELTERFDGVRPDSLRVPQGVLTLAVKRLNPSLHDALQEAIARVRRVHADQRRTDVCTQVVPGGVVRERFVPVDRVGLYVPGGLAALVSSVVMNVVPAQAAGVPSLAVASPPRRDNPAEFAGYPDPAILAAAELLGVSEVYAVGGAQAIAMFAYGASEPDRVDRDGRLTPGAVVCESVDLVTGPGSIYVVAAKRLLKGQVGIDSEAGPSEIAVLADGSADPVFVAADLISQAEHDVLAASVLVTDDPALADRVDAVLQERVSLTKHADRIRAALTGEQSAVVLVDDLDAGLLVVDAYAAEHLEVHTREAPSVAARVRNAGAIFVGAHSPVSLGDYAAGSNHVLPTGGAAAYGGGLSVQTFLRGIHVVEYDAAALAEVGERVVVLAEAEDLPAHGEAIRARLDLGS